VFIKPNFRSSCGCHDQNFAGYTLIEALVVVVMVGAMFAIATPTWFRFLESQRVNASKDEIYQAIRQTQTTAQQRARDWRFGIRAANQGLTEWAIYPDGAAPSTVSWVKVNPHVQLAPYPETTGSSSAGIYAVEFDYKGNANILRTITLSSKNDPSIKRCVIVSTLLGALRTAKEQKRPDPDGPGIRYCY
jgi:type II secretory pathway pseudopilin PulG